MWHMTHDMWRMTLYMWQVAYDTWQVGVNEHSLKILLPSSNVGRKKDEFCRHTAVWEKEEDWISATKDGIRVNKTTWTDSSKPVGGKKRRSSIAGDKYSAKYLTNIQQITKMFCGLPWCLADYHDLCPWSAHWTGTGDYCTGSHLWLCHIFVSCQKTGNTQTAIYGHIVTSPFAVPFGLYSNGLKVKVSWRYFHKGWLAEWMNKWIKKGKFQQQQTRKVSTFCG